MKIGNVVIKEKFFVGWKFDEFEKYIKSTDIEKQSGVSINELAKRLKIEVPGKVEKKTSDK